MLGVFVAVGGAAVAAESYGRSPVTYTKDIAPILQAKCQDCHRSGGMAPMSLLTYQETRPWAKSIRERVVTRQMPPWFIDKAVGIQHFSNDVSLSNDQIAKITAWVDNGAPMGNVKDMPPPKKFDDDGGWKLAKIMGQQPDLVIEGPDYTMPAHGQDQWFRPTTEVQAFRAALGSRGGDAAVNPDGPQDVPSRARQPVSGRDQCAVGAGEGRAGKQWQLISALAAPASAC